MSYFHGSISSGPCTISSHHLLPTGNSIQSNRFIRGYIIPLSHHGAVPLCSNTYRIVAFYLTVPSYHFIVKSNTVPLCHTIFPYHPTVIPLGGEGKKRPVLDAIHDRDTGKMRVRVNDGREISTTNGAVVEIALTDIGIVLFNPRIMVRQSINSCDIASLWYLIPRAPNYVL